MKPINGHKINDSTPDGVWVSPIFDTPNHNEIVVIACDVEIPGKKKHAKILQTAVYQQLKDNKEVWHCGQPFVLIRWWMRLKEVPQELITSGLVGSA
jgi:hypothetical protein